MRFTIFTRSALKAFVFVMLLCSGILIAQTNKTLPPDIVKYSASANIGDEGSFTTVKPPEKEMSREKKDLLEKLNKARLNNNTGEIKAIEENLNRLNGTVPVTLTRANDITGEYMGGIPVDNNSDFNSLLIENGKFVSKATQTSPENFPNPGIIWLAGGKSSSNYTDTCKLYFSTDGGNTWFFGYRFYHAVNMAYRHNELDMELVYDGTNEWLFCVAGYQNIGNFGSRTVLYRINLTTHSLYAHNLNWPGFGYSSNIYYNPRITSDNAVFNFNPYICLSCSFDSAGANNKHTYRQKYALLMNPFLITPIINYQSPHPNGGFFWESSGNTGNEYIWTDIAYVKMSSSINRIITVFTVPMPGSYNIFTAWSDDYGTSVAGNQILYDYNSNNGHRMAFNGKSGNKAGIIVYNRLSAGNDWDPYCKYTTDGGVTWLSNYIDASINKSRGVDVIAPRTTSPMFKVSYTSENYQGRWGYYTGGYPGNWNYPFSQVMTPGNIDSTTKVIAGYKNNDCLVFYTGSFMQSIYSSRQCITNYQQQLKINKTPSAFSLEQNYPNPFNPSTSIKFSLPVSSMVKLVVYDAAGKIVEELVNSQLDAGSYSFAFNGTNIASGVYFYKLTAGSFSEVKKMLLIK